MKVLNKIFLLFFISLSFGLVFVLESWAQANPPTQMINVTYNKSTGAISGTTNVTLRCQNLLTVPNTARFDGGNANIIYTTNGDGRVNINCNNAAGNGPDVMTAFDFSAAFKTTLNGLLVGTTTQADTLAFNAAASGFADPGFINPAIQFNITIISASVPPAPSPNIPPEVSQTDQDIFAGAFLHLFGAGANTFFDPDDPFGEKSNLIKSNVIPFESQTQSDLLPGDKKFGEFRISELDAQGREIGDPPFFALACQGPLSDISFPFAFSPLLKVNGRDGFLNLDCSKPFNIYEYKLNEVGLDILESLGGNYPFSTTLEYVGTDPEGVRTNFEPLVLNVDFLTQAEAIRRINVNPDDILTRTEFFTVLERVEDDPEARVLEINNIELLEDEERFVPAAPPGGRIIIQGSASFSAGLFEEGENIEERFKQDLSAVTIRPNYKQLRRFVSLADRRKFFNFAEADIEVLNSSRFKVRPSDVNDTVLVDFSASLPVSVSKFKVKGLLRNNKKALRDFRKNGSISSRFIRRPQQRKIALKILRRGGTIFEKTKRIVVPVDFSAEGVN